MHPARGGGRFLHGMALTVAPCFMPPSQAAVSTVIVSCAGCLMNSDERRAARRKRRDEDRARRRAERIKDCTLERIADTDSLYQAQKEAARGVSWKSSVQKYQLRWLLNINRARHLIMEGGEVCRGFYEFDIYERGKKRHISSVHFSERVIQKSLTKNALMPAIIPSLIDNNTANIKGRGTSYAIKRVKQAMVKHYRKHGPDGYILQVDFKSYFASIQHGPVISMLESALDDERVIELAKHMIEVQGDVGLGLGSEPNQIYAIAYPSVIDHFITECCGVEAYVRYMDDFVCFHRDKVALQCILAVVKDKCAAIGLEVNEKKTHIIKMSRGFTFLKKRFSYSETGKVVVRPCRDSITRERRKLKKQARLVAEGKMTLEQMEQSYQSWRGSVMALDAHRTLLSMDALFSRLKAYIIGLHGDPPRSPDP